MPDPSIPIGFDDPLISFDDPTIGFDGTPGPPALPVVLSVSPASGPDAGGTTVTLTGTGLTGAIVLVGGAVAAIVSNTDVQVVITTPPHAAATVHIVVTTPAGTSIPSPADQYTYTSVGTPAAPSVAGVSPAAGPTLGGSIVTITCINGAFVDRVAFGETPAIRFTIDSDTQITATAPAHPPGVVDITLHNPSGTSGITPLDVFTFFAPRPPKVRRWDILARDGSNNPQAAISDFTACTFISRDKAVGQYVLNVPLSSTAIPALRAPQAGIVILCDDEEVFSGPVRDRLRSSKAGLQTFQVSGPDDNFWLLARRANREPDNPAPPYSTDLFDVRGPAACSTVLSQFVDVNLGMAALARRRIPNLTIGPDPVIGSTMTGKGNGQPVLWLLAQLALASQPEISFRVRQSGDALIFTTFLPRDLTQKAVFSTGAGTLGDFDIEEVASNANYVYAAGAGSGTGRLIVEGENGLDINEWGLVEEVLDRPNLVTEQELLQAITFELRAQTATVRTDLHVIDTAGLQWRVDYDIGDQVGVLVDGVKLDELVREIRVDLGRTPGGDDTETVTPSVSSASPKASVAEQAIFSIIRDLQARMSSLELNR